MDVIFVDSNVPMYLIGAPHENRELLESFLRSHAKEHYVTSAEVYQEVVHRYVAIDRRDAIQPAFDALLGVVDDVRPIERADVERAKAIVLGHPGLSARDAVHLAVMAREGITQIMSFDAGFDGFPGVTRLGS